jgi:stage III sporulation protein AA
MFISNVFKYFPQHISKLLEEYFKDNDTNSYITLEEIRLRINKPMILKFNSQEKVFDYNITADEIIETLRLICENSIYSYQNQICNGYITIRGGHRVGISGNVVIENNKVTNINYISSLNFRIAKQIIGCSNKILKYVVDSENNTVYNTLIVSPPGAGKTTLLRDLIRKISTGIDQINFRGITVGLVDERGELAAMYKGICQNDVGLKTDVLDNIPKSIGMKMLIRSMSPNVISADEIGSIEDVEAINYAVCSGIKGIFTAHGGSIEDLNLNPAIRTLINTHIFERIIFISNTGPKGEIDKVYSLNKLNSDYVIY